MKKSYWFALGLFALVLSGCQPKAPTNDGAAGEVATQAPGQIVRLQIWTTEAEAFFTALAREYVAETGATNLRFKVVTFTDQVELERLLVDQMAAGAGPDIIYTEGSWIARNTDKLVPAADDDGFTTTNFSNTFVQSAQSQLVQGDQIWGVPLGVDSLGLYYNDAHIQDRLPDRNLPGRTWAAFTEDVIALTKTDNSFSRFAFAGAALGRLDNVTYGVDILQNILLQQGVNLFTTDGQEVLFDRNQGVVDGRTKNLGEQAFDLFTSFADDRFRHYTWNQFVAPSQTPLADFRAFLRGEVSMVFGYSRDLDRLKALRGQLQQNRQTLIPEADIRVTFLPQLQDPSTTPTQQVWGKVYGLAVSKHSDFPNTAWEFLKFSITKNNLQAWHEATKLPTPRVDLLTEQEATPFLGIFVRQAKFAEAPVWPISNTEIANVFVDTISQIESKGVVLPVLQSTAQALNATLRQRAQRLQLITD